MEQKAKEVASHAAIPVSISAMLVTLGVVYGDIGTSPMYVTKALVAGNGGIGSVTQEFVLGALSLVVWTVTLLTTVKYVLISLRADNHGEGGIFALYSLVKRCGKWLIIPAMLGGAALLADGILTPAVTVTTAIEGLRTIPAVHAVLGDDQGRVVAITLAIMNACAMGDSSQFFADLTIRHPENDNAELLWHCGPFPYSMKDPASKAKMKDMYGRWELKKGDIVLVVAGEVIPGDGEVIEGIASVDESAITGESAPVVRESGGDFCSVTGGTTLVSDWLKIRITSEPGNSFLDRMIALVEGASRKKTPNEIALNTLLVSLTIIFLIVVVTMYPFAVYSGVQIPVSTLIALLVCLIPTTIGGLLSAIGIAGMDRVTRFNVIAMSGKAVEACGDVDTMILDKTGTITFGNRLAADFFPVEGASRSDLIRCAALTSLHDDTPEGKSTLELARRLGDNSVEPAGSSFLEFTAQTRMSGVDLPDGTKVRKGASDAIEQYVKENGGKVPADLRTHVEEVSSLGGTPLVVCENNKVLGVIYLKDTVKPGMVERFERLRAIGIKTIMCTGDNPLTAATIAKEAGVDGFVAECKPEDKIALIKKEQAEGKIVAMTGDGTNDAPALAQANVGLAMNSGTTAAKEAANMVDLDSDPKIGRASCRERV